MERAAKALGHDLPRATAFRKELEIRNKRLEGPTREAVSRSLSHSIGTAALYYQALSVSDSVATYKAIQSLIDGREGRSPEQEGGRAGCSPKNELGNRRQTPRPGRSPSPTPTPPDCSTSARSRAQRSRSPASPRRLLQSGPSSLRQDLPKRASPGHRSGATNPDHSEPPGPPYDDRSRSRSRSHMVPKATPKATPVGPSPRVTPHRRKRFSEQENQNVMTYFDSHIKKREYPSLGECREFLETFGMSDRTAKNIQDKCRNLAGR